MAEEEYRKLQVTCFGVETDELPTLERLNRQFAMSTISTLGIRQSINTTMKFSMHVNAKKLLHALNTLSKHNITVTMANLKTIITERGNNGTITLKMIKGIFTVHVRDQYHFQLLAIIALNFVPACSFETVEVEQALMSNLFYYLFDFMKAKSPYTVLVAKTAYMILKKYQVKIDFSISEGLVLNLASTLMTIAPNVKAIKYVEKMTALIFKQWPLTRASSVMQSMCNYVENWTKYDAYIISSILNNWPITGEIIPHLNSIAKRISSLMPTKNFSSDALQILTAVVKHISIELWNDIFIQYIIETVPDDIEKKGAYMKSTLSQCAALAVKNFGAAAYLSLPDTAYPPYYILIIYCGVHYGCLNFEDFENIKGHLQKLLDEPCPNLRYYAFKTICVYNNKRAALQSWVLDTAFDYFVEHSYDLDLDAYKDYHYYFSHICVVLNQASSEDVLNNLARNLELFYDECISLIKSKQPKQVSAGAQMFTLIRIVFEGNYKCLKTKYKLPKLEQYSAGEAPGLKALDCINRWQFNKQKTWDVFYKELLESTKIDCVLSDLATKWIKNGLPRGQNDTTHLFFNGLQILQKGYENESTEKAHYYIKIALTDIEKCDKLCEMLVVILKRDLFCAKYLICNLENLLITINTTNYYGLTKTMVYMLQSEYKMADDLLNLWFIFSTCNINQILRCIDCDKEHRLIITSCKAVEHMLLACLEVIMLVFSKKPIEGPHFTEALYISNRIIETSDMKKPVTTAAIAIRRLCLSIITRRDALLEVILIKFLEYVLFSIYAAPDYLTSKIRRSPEHRLIIHAIVIADERPNHPFLCRAMEFLLGVLSDSSSSSGSVSAALHSVEIILSDNSLRISTLPFVQSVMVHCINAFSSKDWQIKNAAMQVLQALADRLLGQKINPLFRYHRIEDIFLLIPEIGLYFYNKLQEVHNESFHESIIAILAIFSESHRSSCPFLPENIKIVSESFLKIFHSIICTNTTAIGIFAAKAYAALYPHLYIPFIIRDIVDCLILRFVNMKKNIFYTFICLLQALYERFSIASYITYYQIGLNIIESSMQSLTLFLEKFNKLYEYSLYGLLNIRSNSIVNLETAVVCQLDKRTYQSRLWLNNNIPYLLSNIELKKFPNMLKICLNSKCSLSLKINCLEIVINRYHELIEYSFVGATLLVLLESLFELAFTNDYILITLSNIILLLFEACDDFKVTENLLNKLRLQYKNRGSSSIYFVSVIICLLSYVCTYTEADRVFLKYAIGIYKNASCIVNDSHLNFQAASTLKFLYKCVDINERHDVLKLAFILLLNDETDLEIRKFVSQSFGVRFCGTYETLKVLISFDFLMRQLHDKIKVCRLLIDLTVLTCSLKDFFEDEGNFYFKQNSDICLHKYVVKEMLLKEVKNAFMLVPKHACCELLLNVKYVLSDQ